MEEQQQISVSSMVRQTGDNTQQFLEHIANHIELLENEIIKLKTIIEEANKND